MHETSNRKDVLKMRFEAIKEIPASIERWEESETIPKGAICETTIFDRAETITYKGS